MKQLLLIAILFGSSYCYAQLPPKGLTQQANNAALTTARTAMQSKIAQLESSYAANPGSAASLQATKDVRKMMQDDMQLRTYAIYLETDKTVQNALGDAIYKLEAPHDKFNKLADDPAANHADLLKYAKEFHAQL